MIDRALGRFVRRFLTLVTGLALSGLACAAGTVFWLAPRSNVTLDPQVIGDLAPGAGMIVLRADWQHPDPDYSMATIVRRFKAAGAGVVLGYGWANTLPSSGRSEFDLLKGINRGAPLAQSPSSASSTLEFLDMRDEDLRKRVVRRFADATRELGLDGFAVDRATRTPLERPQAIARLCRQQRGLCEDYARGMDSFFLELRAALGSNATIVYNGLRDVSAGEIEDQARLLAHTNAAAIEYFGLDPREKASSFSQDILPYLRKMQSLPPDKGVLVFGRGPWKYQGYLEDYRWQRYLYSSYLLAARRADMFKYHSSFQVPAHAGRTGGLDRFADWGIELGTPRGPAAVREELWVRDFERGTVVVAPDDGRGGTYRLASPRFTPEGKRLEGSIKLERGTGLILLEQAPAALQRASRKVISAQAMAGWSWSNARLASRPGGYALELQRLDAKMIGDHDVLLDGERSLTPYRRVDVAFRPLATDAAILAVAEVDDPKGIVNSVVVEVGRNRGRGDTMGAGEPVPFRSTLPRETPANTPRLSVGGTTANGLPVMLDGPQLLEGTGYRFRRWSHLRLEGPLEVSEIALSNPQAPLELAGFR